MMRHLSRSLFRLIQHRWRTARPRHGSTAGDAPTPGPHVRPRGHRPFTVVATARHAALKAPLGTTRPGALALLAWCRRPACRHEGRRGVAQGSVIRVGNYQDFAGEHAAPETSVSNSKA